MERLKRMSVFAKVVEFGSFTAAARQLQMSVSSISQTVSKLEDELQVKLLNRSTRSIGLTEAGRIYYQGCRRMLHEVQDVHEQLYAFNNTPIGTLRIGCSSTMAQNVLAGLTAKMLKEYSSESNYKINHFYFDFPVVHLSELIGELQAGLDNYASVNNIEVKTTSFYNDLNGSVVNANSIENGLEFEIDNVRIEVLQTWADSDGADTNSNS